MRRKNREGRRTTHGERLRMREHGSVRNFCRILGPLLIVGGLILVVVGAVDFFGSFDRPSPGFPSLIERPSAPKEPSKFWMCFAGMPLLILGIALTRIGFLGAAARYVAGEIAPVGRDTINYMAHGTRGAVKEVTSAIAEGIRGASAGAGESKTVVRCLKCNEENDGDAKFCKSCGAGIQKTESCPECGELNDPDANFCDNCGKTLAE